MEKTRKRNVYIDYGRFVLMILGGIACIGQPYSQSNTFIRIILSFAAPTFYILSGYLVMRKSENRSERILRAIKKTAIVFVLLLVFYFLLNFALYFDNTLSAVKSRAFWFNFVVLNYFNLPIGGHLWYIQGLLYAYIIFFIADKLKLLKYNWLNWLIIGLCFTVAFLTGDLSGVIGFKFQELSFKF